MQRLSDIALIAQVVTLGSERAFEQLVKAHQEAVRRFLRRLTAGDHMRADDLAQETFIHAWQHLSSFRQLAGFETWLLKIAYRVFLDDQRKQKQQPSAQPAGTLDPSRTYRSSPFSARPDITTSTSHPSPLDPRLSTQPTTLLQYDIDLALSSIPDTQRTCVILQCIEGLSIKDISSITGMPENTVKSNLSRGKKNLANYLRNHGYNR